MEAITPMKSINKFYKLKNIKTACNQTRFKVFWNSFRPIPSDKYTALTSFFAVSTGSVAANLKQIPNQPTKFKVKFIWPK